VTPRPISPERDGSRHARLTRSRADTRESALRYLALVATSFALGFAPLAARAAGAGPDETPSGFERTIRVGPSSVELRVHAATSPPGSAVSAGEGSIATPLPGEGQLTLRVPYVVSQSPAVGNAQLAASYELAKESSLLPNLAVVARVDLPTAPGARGAHPGVRATAAKKLGTGVIEAIRVESELWTAGPSLAPSYRALIGTTLRLHGATSGTVDLIALRPGPGAARENLAQLGLAHRLDPATSLHVGVAAGLGETASAAPFPFRATLGFERKF
jgi:hypothetical protein